MIIKNGMVIDPTENRMFNADIYIKSGKIEKIVEKKNFDAVDEVDEWVTFTKENGDQTGGKETIIDATGLYIAPGLVDPHVHFRDPGFTEKEDIISGAEAAKKADLPVLS